jgi:SNF2 family DNA or RNA helicase
MDVRNQLLITGHPLGKIPEAKFKKDFAGQEATGYGGAYQAGDFESQVKAAENLNKWLNLSGVYVRRSKEDIRETPNLEVKNTVTPVDQGAFNNYYDRKLSSYANPRLPVSKLIAARETIAHLKTDQTTQKVLNIVQSNKDNPNSAASKIVVFTNFVESARQLVDRIDSGLRRINPAYHVITYLSDTKKRERESVKQRFTNDPNAKVLVMSMKMGGTGIDFPNAAQNMIINDFDWTPEAAEQSEGRIYRINTNHPVNIDYMVAEGIDKKLFDKVKRKRELASIIQKWRKEFHGAEHNEEALRRIVDAQREMNHIDDDMVSIINSELPGAGEAVRESFSFRDHIISYEAFYTVLFG